MFDATLEKIELKSENKAKKQSSLDISFIRCMRPQNVPNFSYEMFVFFIKVQTSYTLVSAV